MKIQKSRNKLIQLQILKLCYKKKNYNFETNMKQIEIHLNKISNIIYKYHITHKRILFLGFPKSFEKVIKNTKHALIPEHFWFDGMLNNRINEKEKMPRNIFKLLKNLKTKVDLIVLPNIAKQTTAIKESYIGRIPVITVNKESNILNLRTTYKSVGNYNIVNQKIENNYLFFSFIKTTLNKAKKAKKIKIRNPKNLYIRFR